jgi:hypothetical protein
MTPLVLRVELPIELRGVDFRFFKFKHLHEFET